MDRFLTTLARVTALADGQFGVISGAQLHDLGVSRDWIRSQARRGLLRRLHHGVYAVGHTALRREGRWLAAVLAVGPHHAWLSHLTAAAFWSIAADPLHTVHVTTTGQGRSRPGITVHRTRHELPPIEAVRWHGTTITKPERTIVDLADTLSPEDHRHVTDAMRTIDTRQLRRALDARPTSRARTLCAPLLDDGPRTRSELERAFLRMARGHGLPAPACNVWLHGLLVDAHWPEHELVVECDSKRWHSSWAARRTDHARDAKQQARGQRTVRLTWAEVHHDPAEGAARIRPFLRR